MNSVNDLLDAIKHTPETVGFSDVMDVIAAHYHFTAVTFQCGEVVNEAGSNEGSCKILAFAKMHALSEPATLSLFGRYYREDVLQNPGGDDHGNIRNFMVHGWQGVSFASDPLVEK